MLFLDESVIRDAFFFEMIHTIECSESFLESSLQVFVAPSFCRFQGYEPEWLAGTSVGDVMFQAGFNDSAHRHDTKGMCFCCRVHLYFIAYIVFLLFSCLRANWARLSLAGRQSFIQNLEDTLPVDSIHNALNTFVMLMQGRLFLEGVGLGWIYNASSWHAKCLRLVWG